MDKYLDSGVHPDLEQGRRNEVYPLPERDPNRPHVFIEVSCKGELLGAFCPHSLPLPPAKA